MMFPSPLSKREMFYRAFKAMDIGMLEEALEQRKVYDGLLKKDFLCKVLSLFETFKEAGDTCLELYLGTAEAALWRFEQSGFAFVGNKSRKYVSFIIHETKERIEALSYCENLIPIGSPELGEFIPNPIDFKAMRASNFGGLDAQYVFNMKLDLRRAKAPVSLSLVKNLLEKHRAASTDEYLLAYYEKDADAAFYRQIYGLYKFSKYFPQATQGLREYNSLDMEDKKAVLRWVVGYEELHWELVNYLPGFGYEEIREESYLEIEGIKIALSEELKQTLRFWEILYEVYWAEFSKYQDLLTLLPMVSDDDQEAKRALFSLKYNLEQRGISLK